MLVWPSRSGETSRLNSMGPVAERDQVWVVWWKEKQDEVVNMSRCRVAAHNRSLHAGFGWFTPQNQHRAGTTVAAKS
jgi:hypothetical protein